MSDSTERMLQFQSELKQNLTENILPYWLDGMKDPRGGYYGRRDGIDMLHADAPKGAILHARILWTFSAAHSMFGNQEYLAAATGVKDYILNNFVDKDYGGVYWSLNRDGSPLDDKKQFYAIAFAVYGLAEYVRATGDKESLDAAIDLFRSIERHSRATGDGGYREAATRSWQPIQDMRLSDKDENVSRTMNTHLHILEAYAALIRVWRTAEMEEALRYVLKIMLDKILNPVSHHLGLFFDENWTPTDDRISYGHDIEASWLLLEAARELVDKNVYAKVLDTTRHIAQAALQGRCVDGSMVYERHANGRYDNEKHWWVQAEAVVGQMYLAAYHGISSGADGAMLTWDYISRMLVDEKHGEWFWSILPDGSVNRHDDKAGFWKCPYHNGRMCLEALRLMNKN